jgi:hypothetical protein
MALDDPARDLALHERQWMGKELLEQRLVALFGAGCLLLNFPLLALWDRDATLGGVPLFPAALFLIWGGLIALLGWIVERDDGPGADDRHGGESADERRGAPAETE